MFRIDVPLVLLVLVAISRAAIAQEDTFESNLKANELAILIKSISGGWHISVVPKDSPLIKNGHRDLYRIVHVSKTTIRLISAAPQDTGFGKMRIDKRVPMRAVTEVSRYLTDEEEKQTAE